ncbi:hypothetical protein RM533_07555 [Croceicoccus sp. F390]|uniref:Uncharacterized protein n=1 Tax=Croceicoccus esteveae TaxID=3075597 RepID=A0ABU2ZHF6_9SPHN|nr:hypothetical protein [Croceicoccus sp. F390]MDT0576041.1 hypothetical protein [Croceicoccus sp. F390]
MHFMCRSTKEGGGTRPFEIFINSKNTGYHTWTLALTRSIPAVFRRGGDGSFLAEELKAVLDPRGGAGSGEHYASSLLAVIGAIIEGHMAQFVPAQLDLLTEPALNAPTPFLAGSYYPQCEMPGMIREDGCKNASLVVVRSAGERVRDLAA